MDDKSTVKANRPAHPRSHRHICEKRSQARLLCADLVKLSWTDAAGTHLSEIVILENLSPLGVGLFAGVAVPPQTPVILSVASRGLNAALYGAVRQCVFRENGYIIGIELDPDSRWAQQSRNGYTPNHLLDVSCLDLS